MLFYFCGELARGDVMGKQKKWEKQFEKLELLGEGGNAKVYRVKRIGTSQEYALKSLEKMSNEKQNRFVEEIHIMSEYHSQIRGILPVIDYSENEYWYTMPIAEPAVEYIRNHKLDIKAIIMHVLSLCDTLIALHSKGIYHRDIKPSNIYFYDGIFCLGDFGLVDFPENDHQFTRSDKGLGAIFTIAPEMKRNPRDANGQEADVFSLAKTLWMFLCDDEKGFDGVYNYADVHIGLHYIDKYRDIHLAELEKLLTDATNTNPDKRPTASEFKAELLQWLEIYSDYYKSQLSDWAFLSYQLFGNIPPESTVWSDLNVIVRVLNVVGNTPAYNHMLLHDKGGVDFLYAKPAAEYKCIEIHDTLGSCYIIRPTKLYFENFSDNFRWNYFLLEFSNLSPILEPCYNDREYLVEDTPGHYVSAQFAQYGVYDYDTGIPLPSGYRIVCRYTKGKFLIVMKAGPYNMISSTYDGRHGSCSHNEFRIYIEHLIKYYTALHNQLKNPGLPEQSANNEVERRILSIDIFSKNPFESENRAQTSELVKVDFPGISSSKKYIDDNFCNFNFKSVLLATQRPDNPRIEFFFTFIPHSGVVSVYGQTAGLRHYVCKDGETRKIAPYLKKRICYSVYDRNAAIQLRYDLGKEVNRILEEHHLTPVKSPENYFSIEMVRAGKPIHLFTKREIEDIMRAADDRVPNQLVINEDGYAQIINNDTGCLYPVRLERWDAGNVYVGRYSSLSILDDVYVSSLLGWLAYLQLGYNQYIDYFDRQKNEEELIAEIKKYY